MGKPCVLSLCGGYIKKFSEVEQLGESTFKIGVESRFIEDIGLDSLDIVELIMAVEEEFNMEILDEEAEQMFKVSDMVNNIVSKY